MFGTKHQIKKNEMNVKSINVGNEVIPVKQHVRNLGGHLDVELKMGSHVNEIVKADYYHLRQLRAIRRYLTQNATKVLVHALILSRLDYGNALLYGIPEGHLNKLQKALKQRGAPYYRAKFARSHNGYLQTPALASSPLQN